MKITYKRFKNTYGEIAEAVDKYEDGVHVWSIPFDPNNTDYQEYLAWVAEGNTAEAAE
tara:strand:- start:65 stop:238 length:174 start_codon:yes stop_codon:yes gene_type:complete